MKKISMKKFAAEVKTLAELNGKTYYNVRVTIAHFTNMSMTFVFDCYIDGYSWHSGATTEEALQKLKDVISPPVSDIDDAFIELIGDE